MTGLAGEVRNLAFDVPADRRERLRIVDVAHLNFAPGELVALAGPSGSGKSTLLYLLSGLLKPSAGSIAWAGRDLATMAESARDRWRRDNAGFVFQNFHLIDELSPLDNVLTPGWFSMLSTRALAARGQSLLDRFGVPGDRRRASLLSRGEQQRVAIARALLFDPKIIFADEPTASLDGVSGTLVVSTIRDLAATERKTVVVASHDPALLAVASRVVSLDHGRVVSAKMLESAA